MTKWNYDTLKDAAKEMKVPIPQLVALAPKNDPFYMGTPSDIRDSDWFSELWDAAGYREIAEQGGKIHIRRAHYQVMSQRNPPIVPSLGTPYENTDECWGYINQASKASRYMGSVPIDAFTDHRNPEPHIHYNMEEYEPYIDVSGEVSISGGLPPFPEAPNPYLYGFGVPQRYHVECWAEKSTMNDVLLPVCQQYGANLVTGVGELSITAVYQLMAKRLSSGHPLRVLYISDFDPAGRSMPVAVSRKLEFFADNYDEFITSEHDGDMDIKLWPIVLTPDQCRKWNLPRTPIKEKERRAGHFEQQHGEGATELDALEALYPGELGRIVRDEIRRYYDNQLSNRVYDMRRQIEQDIDGIRRDVLDDHDEAIQALRDRHADMVERFGGEYNTYAADVATLWETLAQTMRERTESVIEKYELPEPAWARDKEGPLYSTDRPYFEQLNTYKVFQGKSEVDAADE